MAAPTSVAEALKKPLPMEGRPHRVDLTRSRSRRRMTAICALLPSVGYEAFDFFPLGLWPRASIQSPHRRPRHPGERLNFPVHRARFGRMRPVFQRVAITPWRTAARAMHAADAIARTAGDWHGFPLRFDLARHLDARRICKSMGLFLRFFSRPYPRGSGADIADNRLAALALTFRAPAGRRARRPSMSRFRVWARCYANVCVGMPATRVFTRALEPEIGGVSDATRTVALDTIAQDSGSD
jgi:hypothetical protein